MRRTEREMQFRSRGVRRTPPTLDCEGRAGEEERLKNLNLYLDLSKEKGCKMCRIGWIRSQPERKGKGNFTTAWRIRKKLEVRECKFYDQSSGLIRKQCPSAVTSNDVYLWLYGPAGFNTSDFARRLRVVSPNTRRFEQKLRIYTSAGTRVY